MAADGQLFRRLASGLGKTRARLFGAGLFEGGRELDQETWSELENRLLAADVGVETTDAILGRLQAADKRGLSGPPEVLAALHEIMVSLLSPCEQALLIPERKPFVILVTGVNGVGKTTTIAKLAQRLQRQRHSVLLAAADTFRAAAIDQLRHWGERTGAPVIAQQPGADAGAVLYNALQAATARGADIVIADTAGRLHNKDNLMEELKKIHRVIRKFDDGLEVETLLTLDAGVGMNAVVQAREFLRAVPVSGLALTKLDGTAKGGVAFALAQQLSLPIRYLGAGEAAEDLQPFHADRFVRALLDLPAA